MNDIDPIAQLAALTPTTGRLQRDKLLFALGQASAPAARPWKILAAILALAQGMTVAVWWLTPPRETIRELPAPAAAPPAPTVPDEAAPLTTPDPSSYVVLVRRWEDGIPSTCDMPLSPGPESPRFGRWTPGKGIFLTNLMVQTPWHESPRPSCFSASRLPP